MDRLLEGRRPRWTLTRSSTATSPTSSGMLPRAQRADVAAELRSLHRRGARRQRRPGRGHSPSWQVRPAGRGRRPLRPAADRSSTPPTPGGSCASPSVGCWSSAALGLADALRDGAAGSPCATGGGGRRRRARGGPGCWWSASPARRGCGAGGRRPPRGGRRGARTDPDRINRVGRGAGAGVLRGRHARRWSSRSRCWTDHRRAGGGRARLRRDVPAHRAVAARV